MSSAIIDSQIKEAKEQIKITTGKAISDDRAFSHVILKYIFGVDYIDHADCVTDGTDDGGIDFLYYDDEEAKLILCQSKYTKSLQFNDIIAELDKMYSTVQNFKKAATGSYNDDLKRSLQNALDRLPDDNADNIEYQVFTTAPVDINNAMKKVQSTVHGFPADAVVIFTTDEIEKGIQRAQEQLPTVKEEKIRIDKAKNYVEYTSNDLSGLQCNVLSTSIVQLYNKYAGAGLFDLNIRRYVRNTLVDSGIKSTLEKDRENFWFLNNGIIIACTDYVVDGDTIKLFDFSIVNGGQTTTLIGTYKGTNTKEFYIPCKIVATKEDSNAEFYYTKIAEATNSQKPIYPRDLKSNAPEMVRLAKMLESEDIYLEIKRGFKPKKKYPYSLKNDELGQILLSFVHQQPGTSRSGKRKIFDTANTYDKLFKVNYAKEIEKKEFLIDLIKLDSMYSTVEQNYKTSGSLTPNEMEVLNNGKQTIFALLGVCYRLANGDIKESDIKMNPKSVSTIPVTYGKNISNYTKDDFDEKLDTLIKLIIASVADSYTMAFNNGLTTSVSNFMKTDLKYYDSIVSGFSGTLGLMAGKDIKASWDIFNRK